MWQMVKLIFLSSNFIRCKIIAISNNKVVQAKLYIYIYIGETIDNNHCLLNLATYSFILHSTKHHRHNCKLTMYSLRYGKDVPVNSQVDFGEITPTFGRTQYFLGDVVFTCQIISIPSSTMNFILKLHKAGNRKT